MSEFQVDTSAPACLSVKANHDTAPLALCLALVEALLSKEGN